MLLGIGYRIFKHPLRAELNLLMAPLRTFLCLLAEKLQIRMDN